MRFEVGGVTCYDVETAMAVLHTRLTSEPAGGKFEVKIIPGQFLVTWGHPETHSKDFHTRDAAREFAMARIEAGLGPAFISTNKGSERIG